MTGLHQPHDEWIIQGCGHKCACGAVWYDSDGGPCHEWCNACKEMYDCDDDDAENGLCGRCAKWNRG